MKRNICLTLLICMMAFGLKAQLNYWFHFAPNGAKRYYSKAETINTYKSFKRARIKEVMQIYFRNGKPKFTITSRYNPSTFIYQIENCDSKNKRNNTNIYYNNDTQIVSSYYINNKKDTDYFELFSYDDRGKCTETIGFDENKKKYYTNKCEWYEMGKMKSRTYEDLRHKRFSFRTEYGYYDDAKLKEERHYRKNKLEHKYTYACSPVGEKVNLNKEESKICTIKNKNEDGSYYSIFETNEGKKGISRVIEKFSSDSLLVSYESYGLKGDLHYKYTYIYDNKKITKQLFYRGDKLKSTNYYFYGSDDLLSSSYSKNKRGKKIRDYRYTCTKYE
jgi:hypothetical protein